MEVAGNELVDTKNRAYALSYVRDLPQYNKKAQEIYKHIIKKEPSKWYLLELYIKHLEKNDQINTAIAVADNWISDNINTAVGFERYKAIILKSELQMMIGDIEDAWKTIKPIIESYYGPAMKQGIDALVALDRLDDALMVSKKLNKRYPNHFSSLLPRIKVLWLQGKYSNASGLIKNWRYYMVSHEIWRWKIGKLFTTIFADKPVEVELVMDSLIASGIEPFSLGNLAMEMHNAGHSDVAFKLLTKLKFGGMAQKKMNIYAYTYLKKWKGRAEALRWLKKNTSLFKRNPLSMFYYQHNEFELLWELIPYPAFGRHPQSVWLYRAAAYTEGAKLSSTQHKALMEYYQSENDNLYDRLGRFLLGKTEEKDIASLNINNRAVSEVTYFLGIKALSENRFYEAADWFRCSIETGETMNGEYSWSYDQLYRWKNHGRSLEVLNKQGKLFRHSADKEKS